MNNDAPSDPARRTAAVGRREAVALAAVLGSPLAVAAITWRLGADVPMIAGLSLLVLGLCGVFVVHAMSAR